MKLRWTRPALADLIEAQSFIALDDPQAARMVAQRVWDAASRLRNNPNIGRIGHVTGTHEWVVTRTPYIVAVGFRDMPSDVRMILEGIDGLYQPVNKLFGVRVHRGRCSRRVRRDRPRRYLTKRSALFRLFSCEQP